MSKFFGILLLVSSMASAAEIYEYQPGPNCSLKKYINKKWVATEDFDVQGAHFTIVTNKDGRHASFRKGGVWHLSQIGCFHKTPDAELTPDTPIPPSHTSRPPQYFAELRGIYNIMTGSGTDATSQLNSQGVPQTTSKYAAGFAYGGRLGYFFKSDQAAYVDINLFSGKTDGTLGSFTGTAKESAWNFDLGYQRFFSVTPKYQPFFGIEAGYTKFSGTISYPKIPIEASYGSGTFNLALELGLLYPLKENLSFIGSFKYSLLFIKTATITESNDATNLPVGTKISNSMSYNHLGLNFGIHYSF